MGHLDDGAVWRYSARLCSDAERVAIQRHLVGCAPCAARIEGDTRGSGVGSASMDSESGAFGEAPLERGAPLGRYLVLQQVGQGGMGVVYSAYDPELNRKVAVKLLRVRAHGAKPVVNGQARLLREAQAMARVSHPNVIHVYDVGTIRDRVFVAMELVEGVTLKTWLQERKRGWREVMDTFAAAGRGLAAAHAAGLVHRDFKPENVLVGNDGRVRVTDFGLARLSTEESQASLTPNEGALLLTSNLTQAGKVVGTPFYMAPEQHRGVAPDARSDQFSFCAALYMALYGKRPFEPARLRQRALAEKGLPEGPLDSLKSPETPPVAVAQAAATQASQVEAPEDAQLAIIMEPPRDVRIPGYVRRAVLRGLSLRPDERFPSMEVLLSRLVEPAGRAVRGWAAVTGLAALAAIGFTYRGWADRREALCGGAESKLSKVWDGSTQKGIEAAFLATQKPFAAETWRKVHEVLERYAQGWGAMHVDACQATRVRGEQSEAVLSLRMACLDKRLKEFGALTEQFSQADDKVLERAMDAVNALSRLEPCADPEELSNGLRPPDAPSAKVELAMLQAQVAQARALNESGRYKAGLQTAQAAVAGTRKLGYRPLLAEALMVQGWLLDHLDDMKGAEKSFVEAVWAAEAGRDDEVKVLAASSLVQNVGNQQMRPVEGHLWAGLARATLNRLGGRDDLYVNLALSEGNMLASEGKYPMALGSYQHALELSRRALPVEHPWVAAIYENIGTTQAALGNRPGAIEALKKAVELNERIHGPQHPSTASSHNNLASALLEEGDARGALENAQNALEVWTARLGPDHREVAVAHNNVGTALAMLGRYGEALDHHVRALAIKEKTLPKNHPGLGYALEGMGHAYLQLGRPQDAVPVLERAVALKNPDPVLMAHARFHLAQALTRANSRPRERERARVLAVQAREAYLALGKKADAAEAERFRERLAR